jgi:TonB-dependent receptor
MALAVAGACATLCAPAPAQEVPPPATADTSQPTAAVPANTVVVTGIRAAMQSTINLKRNADGIVDGIVADDIGKFPDTNLAEAVQRISGVSIDRSRGEGSRVTVRGVGPDFNLVLLNGRQMPAANLEDRAAAPSISATSRRKPCRASRCTRAPARTARRAASAPR